MQDIAGTEAAKTAMASALHWNEANCDSALHAHIRGLLPSTMVPTTTEIFLASIIIHVCTPADKCMCTTCPPLTPQGTYHAPSTHTPRHLPRDLHPHPKAPPFLAILSGKGTLLDCVDLHQERTKATREKPRQQPPAPHTMATSVPRRVSPPRAMAPAETDMAGQVRARNWDAFMATIIVSGY